MSIDPRVHGLRDKSLACDAAQRDALPHKVELSRVVYCTGSKLSHASHARCLLPNKMMSKSTLLFVASMAIGALADGDYPWQAPSSTDSMLIFKLSHPYLP